MTPKLIILSSHSTKTLLEEAEKYDIHQVGSLSVSNSQFFLTALGVTKVKPELTIEEPKVATKAPAKSKPK